MPTYTKSEIIKMGYWPQEFLKDLVSEVPPLKAPGSMKLKWNCPLHGEYEQQIKHHLSGSGCPKCGITKNAELQSKTKRDKNKVFIGDMPDNASGKDYAIKSEFIEWRCSTHGIYKQTVSDHLRNHGCPHCWNDRRGITISQVKRGQNPFPQWFINDLEGSPDKDAVLSQTLTVKDKARFVCPVHGLYYQAIEHHLAGHKCPTCAANKIDYSSSYEKRLEEDLSQYGPIRGYRGLIVSPVSHRPMELDLYFPKYKLAVEVNGLYYHSLEKMNESLAYNTPHGKKYYHKQKTDLCVAKGVQLIHLWEDSLRDHYSTCLNLIKSKLGVLKRTPVYARSCSLRIVPSDQASVFFTANHIQGYGKGQTFGLYYQDKLLSAIQVLPAPSNWFDQGTYELNRYASDPNYFVVGGVQKLMKNAERHYNISEWVSYADLEVSNGALYYRLDFIKVGETPIDYKYIYKGTRVHKFNFRKERFQNKGLKYDSNLTEAQLAELNSLTRVYDCGKLKFIKKL